ncbi:MAG: hypothetical protein ACTSQP_07940 [Promethearchaeota archaeon]
MIIVDLIIDEDSQEGIFIKNISICIWIAAIIFLLVIAIYFFREAKQKENIFFRRIGFFFFLFLGASICRLINKFFIGYRTKSPMSLHYEGLNLILISFYAALGLGGLFFIYYALEKEEIKKTHYLFSILTLITLAISVLNYWLPENISIPYITFYIVYPLWITTLLALPSIYVGLAIISSGIVRRKAIILVIGIVIFEFSVAMNSPEATPVFIALGPYILLWAVPCMQILGCYLLYKGFKMV